MGSFVVREDDLTNLQTQALIEFHQSGMHALTPPEHSFSLDLSKLKDPSITFFSAWGGEKIAGIGALKKYSSELGEVKTMRTHPDFLRKGVSQLILDAIINKARTLGIATLALETGPVHNFEAAVALYLKNGFVQSGPFADYKESPYNFFYQRSI